MKQLSPFFVYRFLPNSALPLAFLVLAVLAFAAAAAPVSAFRLADAEAAVGSVGGLAEKKGRALCADCSFTMNDATAIGVEAHFIHEKRGHGFHFNSGLSVTSCTLNVGWSEPVLLVCGRREVTAVDSPRRVPNPMLLAEGSRLACTNCLERCTFSGQAFAESSQWIHAHKLAISFNAVLEPTPRNAEAVVWRVNRRHLHSCGFEFGAVLVLGYNC